jgi:hypothetical protein
MNSAKQFVPLGSKDAKTKGGDGTSFLAYKVQTMLSLGLPFVVATGTCTGIRANTTVSDTLELT